MYEEADSTKLRKKKEEKKGKVLLRYHRQTKFPYNYHFFLLFCVCGWFIFLGSRGLAKCETNGFSKLRELYNNVYLQKE